MDKHSFARPFCQDSIKQSVKQRTSILVFSRHSWLLGVSNRNSEHHIFPHDSGWFPDSWPIEAIRSPYPFESNFQFQIFFPIQLSISIQTFTFTHILPHSAWQSFFHRWTVPDFHWAQDQAIAAQRQRLVAQLELGASIWVPRDWRPDSEEMAFQKRGGRAGFNEKSHDTLKFIEIHCRSSINQLHLLQRRCVFSWFFAIVHQLTDMFSTRLSWCPKPPIYLPGHRRCRLHGWWWGCHHLEHWRQWLGPLKAVATKTRSPHAAKGGP